MPELRFPEFWDKDGWKKQKIGKYLTESRVKGSKGDVAKKLTVKLWGNGVFKKNESLQGSVNTQYYRRRAGQFMYSKLDFLNQAFGIIPSHLDNYESTVDLPCFDANDELDLRFLLEYVQRKDFYKKYGEIADGGRKAKRIQVETFLDFPIILPIKIEQKRIADCLFSLDELITLHTEKYGALQSYKRGLVQNLFPAEGDSVPVLRFHEFENDEKWNVSTIDEIASVSSGGTPSRAKISYWGGQIPWVSTTLIDFNKIKRVNEFITEAGLNNSSTKLFPKGTILMAMYGQGKTRGKVAMLGIEAAINQACAAINLKKGMNGEFVLQNLAARYDEIRDISNQGGQENLSGSLIKSIPFTYPDVGSGEQEKIADCLSSVDDFIVAQAQKIEALKAHKKGLIQQLFPALDEVEV